MNALRATASIVESSRPAAGEAAVAFHSGGEAAAGATPSLAQPEPGLTPDQLIGRAVALRERLRAEQDESDARGCPSPQMQQAFVDAGFYRITQPRRFGGYEMDLGTFFKVMLEVATGHPSAGWCLALGASHAALVASHWPEQAQKDFFGETGHFIAPHRAAGPAGTIIPGDGGYYVEGTWNYASGVPYATHFIGNVMLAEPGQPPRQVVFCTPRANIEILSDWGGEETLGMRASGSNSVRIARAFVPAHHVIPAGAGLWSNDPTPEGTHGTRLHGNPMYLGRFMGPYHASLVIPVIGAARAALDELESISRARKTRFPPVVGWHEHTDVQRPFGLALMKTDAAEAILLQVCAQQHALCDRWAEDGTHFSAEDSFRLWCMLLTAGNMACEAVDLCFAAASSSAARKGQRMERYFRDCAMYRGHTSSQAANLATGLSRLHFGLPMGMYGL